MLRNPHGVRNHVREITAAGKKSFKMSKAAKKTPKPAVDCDFHTEEGSTFSVAPKLTEKFQEELDFYQLPVFELQTVVTKLTDPVKKLQAKFIGPLRQQPTTKRTKFLGEVNENPRQFLKKVQ